jgi:hypothetical protein
MQRLCRVSALAIAAALSVVLVLWPGGYLADVATQANSFIGGLQLVSHPDDSVMAAEATHSTTMSAMAAHPRP